MTLSRRPKSGGIEALVWMDDSYRELLSNRVGRDWGLPRPMLKLILLLVISAALACGGAGRDQRIVGSPRVLPKATVTPRPLQPLQSSSPIPVPEPLYIYYMLYVGMSFTAEPFNDERVREAVRLALDRDEVNGAARRDFPERDSKAQLSIVAPASRAVRSEPADDRESAVELLAEAGHPDGLQTTLYVPPPLEWAARIVGEHLSLVGIQVDIQVVEDANEFVGLLESGEARFFITESRGSLQRPVELLARLLHPRGSENHTDYSDVSFAASFRAGIYGKAEEVALAYAPTVVPLIRYHIRFLDIHPPLGADDSPLVPSAPTPELPGPEPRRR